MYVPLRWRVMAPTEKRPPHRGGHDGADKPEHNLVHHCFASERRRHWASLQALGTIRCRPPAGRAVIGFLRAPATLDQMKMTRSPEVGRSPFWERSSRALPDPETAAPASNASRLSLAPAVKSPLRPLSVYVGCRGSPPIKSDAFCLSTGQNYRYVCGPHQSKLSSCQNPVRRIARGCGPFRAKAHHAKR